MGCLFTVLGFFVLLGGLIAFEAIFFAFPLICAIALCSYHSKHSYAPTWWKVLTILVGIVTTIMFAVDVFDEAVDIGSIPFIILIIYGIISAIFFASKRETISSQYIARRKTKISHDTPSDTPKTCSTTSQVPIHAVPASVPSKPVITKTAEDLVDELQKVLDRYEEIWCDDECTLLLDDCSMAISTYPNSGLPLAEIMKQTATSYTHQMNNLMGVVAELESVIDGLCNLHSFTQDELDALSELYDSFTSLTDSLAENYDSLSEMTTTLKNDLNIPSFSVINANKVLVTSLEKYRKDYTSILATHSAINKKLCTLVRSIRVSVPQRSSEDSASPYTDHESNTHPSSLLSRVRKNLTVDSKVFNQYGMSFKYNLVEECDTLQLNFELSNTKKLAGQISKGNDLAIKANVYDANGKLLCIEEVWVEYVQLKSDYTADFFYFSGDNMDKAYSMRIYAVDPRDEDDECDDDEDIGNGIVAEKSDDVRQILADEAVVSRFNEILNDSLSLLKTTTYPKTFFGRYEDALTNAKRIASMTHSDGHRTYAQEIIDDLTINREVKVKEFVDRCFTREKLYSVKTDLLSGQYSLSDSMIAYINELLEKIENADTDIPASGEYIYCSLSFGSNGKTYYYKTTDTTLKCGDEVVVHVGDSGRKSIAKIEKIEIFKVGETPYPPNLTKDILGRCPC